MMFENQSFYKYIIKDRYIECFFDFIKHTLKHTLLEHQIILLHNLLIPGPF